MVVCGALAVNLAAQSEIEQPEPVTVGQLRRQICGTYPQAGARSSAAGWLWSTSWQELALSPPVSGGAAGKREGPW